MAKKCLVLNADDLSDASEWMRGIEAIDNGKKIEITIGSEEDCVIVLGRINALRDVLRAYLVGRLKEKGIEPPKPVKTDGG